MLKEYKFNFQPSKILSAYNSTSLCGVYFIKNTKRNKFYIGSSNDIKKRLYQHKNMLTENKHHSTRLQNDFNEDGIECFVFGVLMKTNQDERLLFENKFIQIFSSYKESFGYNIISNNKNINYFNMNRKENDVLYKHDFSHILNENNRQLLLNNLIILKPKKQNDKLFSKYNQKTSLSKSNIEKNELLNLQNIFLDIRNIQKNIFCCHGKEIYVCLLKTSNFLDCVKTLNIKGFKKSLVELNCKEKEDKRRFLVFACNIFINQKIYQSYLENGVKINNDDYSLAILVNWIIRVGELSEDTKIYIPSKRMRDLLENWILGSD